ncbi:LysR substrate-binding domain-containing protein [Bdellovibrio sp. HCB2-146]|uniref:LysR family transcriptional regulator n=1 Tax=Bdellovibrio sp. HCB2-146 TaxID=3394362 RepID=UPI0039BD2750
MNLDGIDVFVKVVQAGSFTVAARQLGMPVTTVSGKVAALEKRLGITLIHRTTRKLNVTESGEAFYKRCVRALAEVEAGEKELTNARSEPEGVLRLTATADVARVLLAPIITDYLKAYPKVRVEIIATNRLVDLIGEGVDLGFRFGSLKDSTMIARKFISTGASLWASAAYIKKKGAPRHPRELSKHAGVSYSSMAFDKIRLQREGEEIEVPFQGRLLVDDMEVIKTFVMQGQGIGLIPDFLCEDESQMGKLVKVLPQWGWGSFQLSFVYPAQRFIAPKVQAFIESALNHLRK